MQQIADWLEKLGLGQYAQRFAENDIDASVLPHLTDQSLKELGVSLASIENTRGHPGHASATSTCYSDRNEAAGHRRAREVTVQR
jgi:SAM domain (Sterile alpha motif)